MPWLAAVGGTAAAAGTAAAGTAAAGTAAAGAGAAAAGTTAAGAGAAAGAAGAAGAASAVPAMSMAAGGVGNAAGVALPSAAATGATGAAGATGGSGLGSSGTLLGQLLKSTGMGGDGKGLDIGKMLGGGNGQQIQPPQQVDNSQSQTQQMQIEAAQKRLRDYYGTHASQTPVPILEHFVNNNGNLQWKGMNNGNR